MSDSASSSHAEPGIRLGDAIHRAAKRFFIGTHRTATPEETLARITPHLGRCGITRLADVTGLDRLGIHTVLGHRPNSPTLSGSAGKGFSLAAATVSAAMEAIEFHHAEAIRLPYTEASWNELPSESRIPVDRLPGTKNGSFRPDRPEFWAWGWDLMTDRPVAAPWTSVALLGNPVARPGLRSFYAMGTNGLASGNHILEAVAAGLYEVIERDSVACWRYAAEALRWPTPRVALETIDSPVIQDLLRRFDEAGIRPLLFDVTSDMGVPTYMAMVYDRDVRKTGMHRGYGTHLEPAVAMSRALTEAVQSRLVLIAGSRDDFFRRDLIRNQNADGTAEIAALESQPATVDGRRFANLATPTFEGDIALLLNVLRRAGIEQALVFDLTQPEMDIPVVRVVVPGLEGYNFDFYAPGARPLAFAGALKAQMAAHTGVVA
ncbi:YcaO-like family protein [Azospirillum doebereinerae]|uniref:YcaO-like family protein n=1 Tax=Azospirillum doebereinerae TaxID=92933 RepID=UPI001EE5E2FE|nr:YcaO-like family protein [Azospirillum doebereinerae]MCG5243418.1 YcaO-like family protein [Azospirillum doebereinerae]